jgi:hypothetical protein
MTLLLRLILNVSNVVVFLVSLSRDAVLFNYLYHNNFQRDIRTLIFGDSQKDHAKNILLSKAVQTFIKNSRRFIEGHNTDPPFYLSVIIYFKISGVFRVKNHDFTPKKSYFFQF